MFQLLILGVCARILKKLLEGQAVHQFSGFLGRGLGLLRDLGFSGRGLGFQV